MVKSNNLRGTKSKQNNKRKQYFKFLTKIIASKIGKIPANRIDRDSWVMDTDIEPNGYGSILYTFKEVLNDKSR